MTVPNSSVAVIDEKRVKSTSSRLHLSEGDVRAIYEELVPTFKLRLQWKPGK